MILLKASCFLPLQKEIVVGGFIRFHGLEAKYAIGSTIEDVIVPALKGLHVEKTDDESVVPLEVSKQVSK